MMAGGPEGLGDMEVDGTPFSELLRQAAAMKTASMKVWHKNWDAFPRHYQASMFAKEDVVAARELPFVERLRFAEGLKEQGNVGIRALRDLHKRRRNAGDGEEGEKVEGEALPEGPAGDVVMNASVAYERALSVFRYIVNTKEDWKNKTLEDEDMEEHAYAPANEEERAQLHTFYVSCYNNLALVYAMQRDWPASVRASDAALAVDPQNVKALYRRAQARLIPISAGATEQEWAFKDLQQAAHIEPQNHAVRRTYEYLRKMRKEQKQADKATFAGLFDRGVVYDTDSNESNAPREEKEQASAAAAARLADMVRERKRRQQQDTLTEDDQDRAEDSGAPPFPGEEELRQQIAVEEKQRRKTAGSRVGILAGLVFFLWRAWGMGMFGWITTAVEENPVQGTAWLLCGVLALYIGYRIFFAD